MKLYALEGACSLASHIVLNELNVPFELKLLDASKGDLETSEFLKINPNGNVPTLCTDDGLNLSEGTAILQYLADQKPELNLMPKSGPAHYKALEWLNYIATELHKGGFSPLWDKTLTDEQKATKLKDLSPKFDFVETMLGNNTYCLGDTYTIVDAYLFTVLSWAPYMKLDLSPWKKITSWQGRVFERTATQKALKAEDLLN
jgi:glutathione S-transferase